MIERIAEYLSVPVDVVERGLKNKAKKIVFAKKSGGNRVAYHPSPELRMLQSWLCAEVFSLFPVSGISMAYRHGFSILDNAKLHKNSNYFVRVDIKDFFKSIKYSDLEIVMVENKDVLPEFALTEEFMREIVDVCCFLGQDRFLPIGYVTSPMISNAVMKGFDDSLASAVASHDLLKSGVLTRYADDFVFSCKEKGSCKVFLEIFNDFVLGSFSPIISVNERKTCFMSKKGGGAIITGLLVNGDGNVVLKRSLRDKIRLFLGLQKKGVLSQEDCKSLLGYISFVRHVDPNFFTKISFKYHDVIDSLGAFNGGA